MAETKKQLKKTETMTEAVETQQGKKKRKARIERIQANNAITVGEIPLKTYEMIRNNFVGIN